MREKLYYTIEASENENTLGNIYDFIIMASIFSV